MHNQSRHRRAGRRRAGADGGRPAPPLRNARGPRCRRRRDRTVRRDRQSTMERPRRGSLSLMLPLLLAAAARAQPTDSSFLDVLDDDFYFEATDEEYYRMPQLFRLDDYDACLARPAGAYCVGSFELIDDGRSPLLRLMTRYSANWVDRFNHTRLHRGVCLTDSCAPTFAAADERDLPRRFAQCVNASVWAAHRLHAQLQHLDYCRTGAERAARLVAPYTLGQQALGALIVVLLALTALSTACDLMLPADHPHRKHGTWALAWSVPRAWHALVARPPRTALDLRACDGLRVVCMLCVIVEHVCWLAVTAYVATPRFSEVTRRAGDAIMMVNSSLVVQVFFVLSNFFLGLKLLQQERAGSMSGMVLLSTFVNRLIRISPAYWLMVAYAGTWWPRAGDGPLWTPLVEREADACAHKWWAQLLYLNNVVQTDEHCLIQTWYLAADMQLYVLGAALTTALARWGGGRALEALAALWTALSAAQLAAAYAWRLQPNLVVHRPEAVHAQYVGEPTFARLYQSPLGNAPSALAGLLVAHAHYRLVDAGVRLHEHKVWAWVTRVSGPLAVAWVALSPLLIGGGPPARLPAAALAAFERPVFGLFVALGLLGAIHNIRTPWCDWFSWSGWRVPARLSFSALLLHMLVDKALVAGRPQPSEISRASVLVEWWGVTALSYAAALPLALLVEMPAVRFWRGVTETPPTPAAQNSDKPR